MTTEVTMDHRLVRRREAGCSACRRIFTGTSAFELHRKGRHGVDRRCEMGGTGLRLNNRGIWGWPSGKPYPTQQSQQTKQEGTEHERL